MNERLLLILIFLTPNIDICSNYNWSFSPPLNGICKNDVIFLVELVFNILQAVVLAEVFYVCYYITGYV